MQKWIFESENFFKSERNTILLIEPILSKLKSDLSIPDESFYNIMIAATEAVNNAVTHGNKLNPEKIVEFTVKANKQSIIVRVSDQGDGFNPENVADCLEPENLLKSSGRGVFIIKELMDDVFITSDNQGTLIEMTYMFR